MRRIRRWVLGPVADGSGWHPWNTKKKLWAIGGLVCFVVAGSGYGTWWAPLFFWAAFCCLIRGY